LRALRIAEGNILVIFSSTIGNVLWVLLLISVFSPYVVDYIRRNRQRAADREAEFQADGES
jgi:TctA family transporter